MRVFVSHASQDKIRSADGRMDRVVVSLRRLGDDASGDDRVRVEVRLAGRVIADETFDRLPPDVALGREVFQRGFRLGAQRDPRAAERAAREEELAELGRALLPLCLPRDAAAVLTDLLVGSPAGTTIEPPPSPIEPTTSVTSPFPTSEWATCSARSGRV